MSETVHQNVQAFYGEIARQSRSGAGACCSGGCDCGSTSSAAVETAAAVSAADDASVLSLGCGFPVERASLQPGETVVDLGSGAGLDCFLAARQVGPAGKVIGIDMTPDMLALAQENAKKVQAGNVEFRQGFLEEIPVADASVDAILSNCVINLSPDKPAVFREMYRILKPGGRVVVSDIVTSQPLPAEVRANTEAWCECVSGALLADEYRQGLEQAGFEQAAVTPDRQFELQDTGTPAPIYSAIITAVKPTA
jgi:ubiquinone/menaquinone biosynthesis C-methylase UbiE